MLTKKTILVAIFLIVVIGVIGVISTGGLTGAVISNKVSCFENSDCNDHISETEDICKNPGSEYSLCVNRPKN
jgi:hypothetical protein